MEERITVYFRLHLSVQLPSAALAPLCVRDRSVRLHHGRIRQLRDPARQPTEAKQALAAVVRR